MAKFIDGFLANMRDKGFARPNRYLVLIQPNPAVASALGYNPEELKQRLAMTCSSATLPSKSFMTHEMAISQPTRMIPYAINSNNSSGASFEFYVLGDMFEKNIFELWQNLIVDPVTKEQSFYDDYAKGSSIIVAEIPNFVSSLEGAMEVLGNRDTSISGITLTEIYPYNFTINGGSQNYGTAQEPLKVKVDFMFREVTRINQPRPRGIDSALRAVDENGRFVRETVRESAMSILERSRLMQDLRKKFTADVVDATLQDAQNDFKEMQRRESKSMVEKYYERKKYDQTRNVPRGVDGRLLNPKVDGLPATNPNDEISQLLTQGLTFLAQGQGFLGF